MQVVPIQALPNQTFQAQLGGQACIISDYQLQYGLFMDVFLNGAPIVLNVICQNKNRIVRDLYLGFPGDLAFYDTQQGVDGVGQDPDYTGLDGRYQLIYIEAGELPAGVG